MTILLCILLLHRDRLKERGQFPAGHGEAEGR